MIVLFALVLITWQAFKGWVRNRIVTKLNSQTLFSFIQMIPSGLPELTSIQDLKYVRDALQPQTTDAEATIFFTR